MSQRTHQKTAVAWWIEFDEEEAFVCLDTDTGQTVAYDISDASYGGEIDKTENSHLDREPEDTGEAREVLKAAISGFGRYKCPYCGKVSETWDERDDHMVEKHDVPRWVL